MKKRQYRLGVKTTPIHGFVVIAERPLRSCLVMVEKIMELHKKNIAIRLDVYERLLDMKRGKDTFSDIIERLLDKWKA